MSIVYDVFDSPIGALTVASDGSAITALHIAGDRYFTGVPEDWQRDTAQPLLLQAKQQLEEYFAGKRTTFDLPLQPHGTPFQERVWQAVAAIPSGTTTTYQMLATTIGSPKAVRAVGTAVGRNPICLLVPCHRVVPSSGGLGGYVAGLTCKAWLLQHER